MFKDIFSKIQDALGNVAPLLDGRRFVAQNDVPPRYVWIRKRISPAGGPGAVGGNPRSLGDDLHVGEIHCWGTDEDDSERLRQALVTVIRKVVQGRSYELGDADITEQDWATCGAVLTMPISLRLPLLVARLPDERPPHDGRASPIGSRPRRRRRPSTSTPTARPQPIACSKQARRTESTSMSDDTKAAPAPSAAADAPVQAPALPTPAPTDPVRKAIEVWQLEKGVHDWLVAFARAQNHWPLGRELTEAELEAAITAAYDVAFR